jgi:hypothetical protein
MRNLICRQKEGNAMKYIPLGKPEIAELLQQAKTAYLQPRRERYQHPSISVQYRLEQAVPNQDEAKRQRLREMYVTWWSSGASDDITNEVDMIINKE